MQSIDRASFADRNNRMRMARDSCRSVKLLRLPVVVVVVVVACLVMCVSGDQVKLSWSSLTLNSTVIFPNMTLVSEGGVFQVGLTSGMQGNRSTPVYTLAIWYAQPPPPSQTVVWVADRSMALNTTAGISLRLSPQGNLQVHSTGPGNSSTLVWTTNTTNLNVTRATIQDTGNLVLLNNANQVVWQSFDTPCDTLLPDQQFTVRSNKILTAWQNNNDWSEGRYSMKWSNDSSNLIAFWRNPYTWFLSPNNTYWPAPVPTPSGQNFSYATLTGSGDFRAVAVTGNVTLIGTSAGPDELGRLVRVTLGMDGNIRMYSLAPCAATWNLEWTAIADACSISGYCGRLAICEAGQCRCPFGFHFADPSDERLGCERNKPLACGNTSAEVADTFGPVELADWGFYADWRENADLIYYTNVSVATCKERCLAMCECVAAVMNIPFTNTGDDTINIRCYLKSIANTLNGTTFVHRQSYLKIAGSLPPPPSGLSRQSLKIVASTVGALAEILAVIAIAFGSIYCSKKVQQHQRKKLHDKWVAARGAMVRFTWREIILMTERFKVKIGEGGFGTVFKGQIGDGITVAVKRLNKELSTQVEKEFLNEVDSIGLIHHMNLVSLLGYCAEAGQRFLVYEYMENGSLDAALFREEKAGSPVLEWRPRFANAIHTARGLAYLHDDCDQQIIHCDVKPENILLDATLSAKVADFGISRIMKRDQTRTVTMHVRGTRGYLAPEYWASDCVSISNKVDVFSYGMVLLEIISGRRNLVSANSTVDILYFPTWAFAKMEAGAFMETVDPALMGLVNPDEVKRALQVAFWCINEKPQMRPSMRQVVQMLQGLVPINLPVPRPDFFDHLESGDADDCYNPLTWSADARSEHQTKNHSGPEVGVNEGSVALLGLTPICTV